MDYSQRLFYLTDTEDDQVTDFIEDRIPSYRERVASCEKTSTNDKASYISAIIHCTRCGADALVAGNIELTACPHCGEYSDILDIKLIKNKVLAALILVLFVELTN